MSTAVMQENPATTFTLPWWKLDLIALRDVPIYAPDSGEMLGYAVLALEGEQPRGVIAACYPGGDGKTFLHARHAAKLLADEPDIMDAWKSNGVNLEFLRDWRDRPPLVPVGEKFEDVRQSEWSRADRLELSFEVERIAHRTWAELGPRHPLSIVFRLITQDIDFELLAPFPLDVALSLVRGFEEAPERLQVTHGWDYGHQPCWEEQVHDACGLDMTLAVEAGSQFPVNARMEWRWITGDSKLELLIRNGTTKQQALDCLAAIRRTIEQENWDSLIVETTDECWENELPKPNKAKAGVP